MGKKAKNAGNTKNRVRTCDKTSPETPYDKMLRMASKAGCKVSRMNKSVGKDLLNTSQAQMVRCYEKNGQLPMLAQNCQQVINKERIKSLCAELNTI